MNENGAVAGCAITHADSITSGACVVCAALDAGQTYYNGEHNIIPGCDVIAYACESHGDEYDDVITAPAHYGDERHVGWEARCHTCGETFNPAGPTDLMHVDTNTGTDCGPGELIGAWG